jgi:hypothetical protein
MVKTLKCDGRTRADSFPCSEWDYLTKTNLLIPAGDTMEHMNLSAFVTPYGKGLDLGGKNGWQWVVDVTDYAPLLKGERHIISGNNQELLDLKFHFISGVSPRDAISVKSIYPFGEYKYEHLADDSLLKETRFVLDPEAEEYMLRARIAGHGHAGPYNCCEWDEKLHTYRINGPEPLNWAVWKDCGFNPIHPQGGTWQFDRAGWCPGSEVEKQDFDITRWFSPGDTLEINYEIEMYSGNGEKEGKFTMSHQLFAYGPANFKLDAGIANIIKPTDNQAYARYNPSCSQPVVEIRNTGKTPLRSLSITYGFKGERTHTYQWQGSLGFLESERVCLPALEIASWPGKAVFFAETSNPNGSSDDQPANNRLETACELPLVLPSDFVMHVETNDLGRASENELLITTADGELVFEHTTYDDSTTYDHVINLKPGCYRLEFTDDMEDGMIRHWWNYYEDKEAVGINGKLELHETDGGLIRELPYDFAEKLMLEFVVK